MKKITLFASALIFGSSLQAQIFSDDFESYAVGSYLGPQSTTWRTWSTTGEGTAEDVTINNTMANSGTKSIYFSSVGANGGPQDVILDFGQLYNSGEFRWGSSFYVNAGKSAYFNFQGSNTIGGVYAMDVFMENGVINVQNGANIVMSAQYPAATWFDMEVVANLTTKIWELKIDGMSVGKWIGATNSVRYVDYYPLNGSQFYVDDVMFDAATYTPSANNASAANLALGSNFANTNGTPTFVVVNTGSTVITSFDAKLTYNGVTLTENVTGLTLAANQTTTVNFASTQIAAGPNAAIAAISNINGAGADDNSNDDTTRIVANPIVPAVGKMVVGEEGTGTWCQWCPRGAVFMDRFEQEYGALDLWAGIAVHNNDPMEVTPYDDGMAFSGFPNAKVDRVSTVDPSGMQPSFETRIQTAPKAVVEVGANFDPNTRVLQVSGTFDFLSAATSGYKVAFVITEDDVTGTTGYAQSNAYSGGGQGPMGGYESLPNPVPASQMVYDHVARDIRPSFGGFANSFPGTINQGDQKNVYYTYVLPASWDEDNIHIIILLIAPNGQIDNAGRATIAQAQANGYDGTGVNAGSMVGVDELAQIDASFKMFPNPTSDKVSLTFNLKNETNVEVMVTDIQGKVIAQRAYGSMNGSSVIEYYAAGLTPGIYMVEILLDGEKITRRLVVE